MQFFNVCCVTLILLYNSNLLIAENQFEVIHKHDGTNKVVKTDPIRIRSTEEEEENLEHYADKITPVSDLASPISEEESATHPTFETTGTRESLSTHTASMKAEAAETIPHSILETLSSTTLETTILSTTPEATTLFTSEATQTSTLETSLPSTTQETTITPTQTSTLPTDVYTTLPPDHTCHNVCQSMTNQSLLTLMPDVNYLMEKSSITLKCQSPIDRAAMTVNIVWLFRSVNPPKPECSLTAQETLNKCEDFTVIIDVDDETDHHIESSITIEKLKPLNTGYYMCQIETVCCSNSNNKHEMSHLLETKLVIESLYTAELVTLGIVAGVLLIILAVGNLFLQRHRKNKYIALSEKNKNTIVGNPKSVLHIPFDDEDEFDDDGWSENEEDC